jgi:hypothetical protein
MHEYDEAAKKLKGKGPSSPSQISSSSLIQKKQNGADFKRKHIDVEGGMHGGTMPADQSGVAAGPRHQLRKCEGGKSRLVDPE